MPLPVSHSILREHSVSKVVVGPLWRASRARHPTCLGCRFPIFARCFHTSECRSLICGETMGERTCGAEAHIPGAVKTSLMLCRLGAPRGGLWEHWPMAFPSSLC